MHQFTKRLVGVLISLCLTLAGLLGIFSGLAFANGGSPETPTAATGQLDTSWAPHHVALDWNGNSSQVVREEERFLFDLVAVPGDAVHRTLTVSNVGNGSGVLTVAVVDPAMTEPDGSQNRELEHASNLYWCLGADQTDCLLRADRQTVQFSKARREAIGYLDATGAPHRRLELVKLNLAQGTSVDLTLGWEFPLWETRGNAKGNDSVELSFDVELMLRAGTLPSPTGGSTPEPSTGPVDPVPSDQATVPLPGGGTSPSGLKGSQVANTAPALAGLPFTGANAVQLAIAACTSLLTGLMLLAWRRRRRDEEEPTRPSGT